jgi:elongation factor Ts
MMDAKRALEETDGDMDRATTLLRERGIADAAKRTGRSQGDGAIGSYLHRQAGRPVIGVLVELASETDFVAKSDDFQQVANDIAMHVAAARPSWIRREEVPEGTVGEQRNLFTTQARNEGKPEKVIDRIVDGKLKHYFAENVLYDQEFVRTERFEGTIGDMVQQLAVTMGENISVARISRIQVGENGG